MVDSRGSGKPEAQAGKHAQLGRREAVALTYTPGEDAPRVVARGYGLVADRIIEEAQRNGVFVHGAPELVDLLMQLDLDQKIPPSLYQLIAELLAWVHDLRRDDGGPGVDSQDDN